MAGQNRCRLRCPAAASRPPVDDCGDDCVANDIVTIIGLIMIAIIIPNLSHTHTYVCTYTSRLICEKKRNTIPDILSQVIS